MARFIMSAACSGAFFVRPRRNYKLWLCGAVAAKERPPGEQTKSPPTNPPFFPYQHKRPLLHPGCQTSRSLGDLQDARAQYHLVIVSLPSGDFSRGAISDAVFERLIGDPLYLTRVRAQAEKVKRHSPSQE
jgi:hypothetical protein